MYGMLRHRSVATRARLSCFFVPAPDNMSSLDALLSALENLDNLFETVEDAFQASMQQDDFERWQEKS
jgi:hypothetical protein